jgi:hypothetical protein
MTLHGMLFALLALLLPLHVLTRFSPFSPLNNVLDVWTLEGTVLCIHDDMNTRSTNGTPSKTYTYKLFDAIIIVLSQALSTILFSDKNEYMGPHHYFLSTTNIIYRCGTP